MTNFLRISNESGLIFSIFPLLGLLKAIWPGKAKLLYQGQAEKNPKKITFDINKRVICIRKSDLIFSISTVGLEIAIWPFLALWPLKCLEGGK